MAEATAAGDRRAVGLSTHLVTLRGRPLNSSSDVPNKRPKTTRTSATDGFHAAGGVVDRQKDRQVSNDRRMKGVLCVTAWLAAAVMVLNAVAGASTVTVVAPGSPTPPQPRPRRIVGRDGRVVALEVDPSGPTAGG